MPCEKNKKNKQNAYNLKQPILEKVFCNHLKCYFFSYISYDDETVLVMKNRANDILKKESTTLNNNL